jgi:hypothetical protein
MRDAFPLPPNSHGLERTGLYCQCCGLEIVLSVQDVFAHTPRGSARRFCDPACRQAAYRRRIANVEENTPAQRQGGRERQLNPSPPASGAKSDRHPGAKSG